LIFREKLSVGKAVENVDNYLLNNLLPDLCNFFAKTFKFKKQELFRENQRNNGP